MASSSSSTGTLDMKASSLPRSIIDEHNYCATVLQLPSTQTEAELDYQLQQQLLALGVLPPQISADIDGMASSLSATTIGSDSNKQGSMLSQSTPPTSCASSEHRPVTQSSIRSINSGPSSHPRIAMPDGQAKRTSGFRSGIRSKMAGFKRKKSPTPIDSIASTSIHSRESDKASIKSGLKSPASVKSSKSSWSSPVSAAKSSYEAVPPIDQEALKRSMQSAELQEMQRLQVEEKERFAEFEKALIADARTRCETTKEAKAREHQDALDERQLKADKAVEELEARQLEEELKMQKEHEAEKRTAMTRLKHMEAYCQSPTPPPTPVDPSSGRPSLDTALPERKVTDRDYHNLAQQYRERDAMDTLHASKINVLRGKQKKAVENFLCKKEREMEKLENDQERELAQIEQEHAAQEDQLRAALESKRVLLEARWQTQALVERTKMERTTGLKYVSLPAITIAAPVAVSS